MAEKAVFKNVGDLISASAQKPSTIQIRDWIVAEILKTKNGDKDASYSRESVIALLRYAETAANAAVALLPVQATGDELAKAMAESVANLPDLKTFEFDILRLIAAIVILVLFNLLMCVLIYKENKMLTFLGIASPIALTIAFLTQIEQSTYRVLVNPRKASSGPEPDPDQVGPVSSRDFENVLKNERCEVVAVEGDKVVCSTDVTKTFEGLSLVHEKKKNPNLVAGTIASGVFYLLTLAVFTRVWGYDINKFFNE
jgi:hypothetical protein